MKRRVGAVLTVAVCTCTPAATQGQRSVPVVSEDAVRLDGALERSEWGAALVLGDEALELRVQQTADQLLLGLRTAPLFVASICLTRGRDVWVFHGSAAAGRARYAAQGDAWTLEESFEWRLRDTPEGPATQETLAAHTREFGWATHTVTTGPPGETEFAISKELLDPSTRIAVGLLLEGDGSDVAGWPIGAEADGCTRRSTIAGPLEAELTFDLPRWEELELGMTPSPRSEP